MIWGESLPEPQCAAAVDRHGHPCSRRARSFFRRASLCVERLCNHVGILGELRRVPRRAPPHSLLLAVAHGRPCCVDPAPTRGGNHRPLAHRSFRRAAFGYGATLVQTAGLGPASRCRAMHLCARSEPRSAPVDPRLAANTGGGLARPECRCGRCLVGLVCRGLDHTVSWRLVLWHARAPGPLPDASLGRRSTALPPTPQDRPALPLAAPSHVRWRPGGRLGHAAYERRPSAAGIGFYDICLNRDALRGTRPRDDLWSPLSPVARNGRTTSWATQARLKDFEEELSGRSSAALSSIRKISDPV